MSNEIVLLKQNAVEVLPDSARYKCRFKIRSATSDQLYLVSYDTSQNCFVCSCRGNIRHGCCKHLTAMGLFGRKNKQKAFHKAKELGII